MASEPTERVARVDSDPFSIGQRGAILRAPTDRQSSHKSTLLRPFSDLRIRIPGRVINGPFPRARRASDQMSPEQIGTGATPPLPGREANLSDIPNVLRDAVARSACLAESPLPSVPYVRTAYLPRRMRLPMLTGASSATS